MKKRITALFTALVLFTGVTFATDSIPPSEELQKEFNREFAGSTEVKWAKVADFYKVSFLHEGQYLMAYFNDLNRIESVSRNISTYTLPLILQKDIEDKLSESSWITDCFELFGNNGTEYYVVVENADQKTIYQSDGMGWQVYKRTEK